jgi:hypothetical protein
LRAEAERDQPAELRHRFGLTSPPAGRRPIAAHRKQGKESRFMAASFKDAKGRIWPILLTIRSARLVVAEHQIDLLILDNKEAGVFNRLTSTPHQITDVVWTLIREKAAAENVTAEAFLDAVDGETVEGMTEALIQSVIDFFRSNPAKVRVLQAAFKKQTEMENEVAALAVSEIESLTLPPATPAERFGRTSTD